VARVLVIAAFVWPVILGGSVWAQQDHAHAPAWVTVLYAAASRICHQRPERSFSTGGIQWPVCGRCAGLYLGAPLGAVIALSVLPGPKGAGLRTAGRSSVILAAVPSAVTLLIEWTGLAPVSTLTRALAAVPLGAAIAWLLVRVTLPARADGVH
jgi:uncharacterized membrane protein